MSGKKNYDYDEFANRDVHHDDGEGNWLISYADLMTLLWGFFVIISAFSTPNPDKLELMKKKTSESMGGKYIQPYNEITDTLKNVLKELNVDKDVQIETLTDGVKITAQSAKFFEPGKANLTDEAQTVLKRVGEVLALKAKDFIILVEGHTDDVPIHTVAFPSNWELSLRRATEVIHMFEDIGLPHANLRPLGLADVQPAIKPEGLTGDELANARAKNRRIIIRLQKMIPPRVK
jgi:chemotaxis protein MotB